MGTPRMIVQPLERISRLVGVEVQSIRDDLLPFPLAGNKFRKVVAEAKASSWRPGELVITSGGVTSNHCRTVAIYAAERGVRVHLVLHGDASSAHQTLSLQILRGLGVSLSVVEPKDIATEIERVRREQSGFANVHVLSGGGHSKAGARAYHDVAYDVGRELDVDHVFVASGTGATQAGIIAGLDTAGSTARVTGVSVARPRERGIPAVKEALEWLDCEAPVVFDDNYVDGGYAKSGPSTAKAVTFGWAHGLPLDATYTGKAFNGLLGALEKGDVSMGRKVLFWHTGGLMNHLESLVASSAAEARNAPR